MRQYKAAMWVPWVTAAIFLWLFHAYVQKPFYQDVGQAYVAGQRGQYAQSIALWDRFIAIHPNFNTAYAERGRAHLLSKDTPQALADYTQAIAVNPYDGAARLERGRIYHAMGRYDKAITDYDRVRWGHFYIKRVYYYRALSYLKQGQPALALKDFRIMAAVAPDFKGTQRYLDQLQSNEQVRDE